MSFGMCLEELAKAKALIMRDAEVIELCSKKCKKTYEEKEGVKLIKPLEYLEKPYRVGKQVG